MYQPKISVVIPNYNHRQYLKQRIESVINQTYKNFEVIILDDCSTDNSLAVIKEYADNPKIVKIICNTVNSGSPFNQWQSGITLATGEWIWLAESDDYADENFLSTMIAAIGNHKNVGLAYCDSNIVVNHAVEQESFAALKNRKFNTMRWSTNYINEGLNEIENYLLREGTINNTSAVLFNREILLSVNPFDIGFLYIGDYYAFVKVLSKSNIIYVQDRLNYYRNPFSSKHSDRYIYYFYEYFLVLNWIYVNLKSIDKKKFFKAFYQNTNFSMYKGWKREKMIILKKLFLTNAWLLVKCIIHNLKRPLFSSF